MLELKVKVDRASAPRREWAVIDTGHTGMFTTMLRDSQDSLDNAAIEQRWALRDFQVFRYPVEWIQVGNCRRYGLIGAAVKEADSEGRSMSVGLGFLSQWERLELDLGSGTVTLDDGGSAPPEVESESQVRIPFLDGPDDLLRNGVRIPITIGEHQFIAWVDTGFSASIAARRELLELAGCARGDSERVKVVTLHHTSHAHVLELQGTAQVGGREWPLLGTAVVLEDLPDQRMGSDVLLLGMEFLRQFRRVEFDWSRRELVLTEDKELTGGAVR